MQKTKKSVLAILLLLTFAASTIMSVAQAQPPAATMKTYAIIDAVPNPVGVGEEVLIRTGIIEATGDASYGWTGITVTVVKPNGQVQTLGPYTTDSTGATFTIYTPDQAGTYKLTTNFPEQTNPVTFFNMEGNNMVFAGTIMKASNKTLNLVVQENSLTPYPGHPLPTEYWSRPIDPQLREWFTISGNWLSRPDNGIALYNDDAPETAHVLWTREMTAGGLTGGVWGEGTVPASAETGDAYEGKFSNSVIMNGVLYYNRMPSAMAGTTPDPYPQKGLYAVDLHTGKELWFRNNTQVSFGQILYFNSFNYDGVFDYIWDTSKPGVWTAYDPFNAEWLYSMTDVPSGTQVFGPSGEILIYQLDYANRWMALWNSTACGLQKTGSWAEGSSGSWGRNVHGTTWNASNPHSYTWNVTIPAGLEASSSFFVPILKVYPDRVVSMAFNQTQVRVWALSTKDLKPGSTSTTTLFDKTWKAPAEWLDGSNTLNYVGASNQVENGVIAVWDKELTKHYGFSVQTGEYLWETESENWLDAYGWGNAEHTWYFAYDRLISVGVGGVVYGYDVKTGETLWTYNMTDAYNEPVTGQNWWGWITMIADGKVYIGTVEHSAEMPLPRGGPFICLNATSGDEIWRVNGMYRATRWGGNGVMGDSIIATMDTYDQRIYAVGKGPSATTVQAPMTGVTPGNSMVISGRVTDISPGTEDYALKARFPNGVPAVSDESMTDWTLYVYKQFSRPLNATGVEVTLDAIDPNGNFVHLGTTTSDANGNFGFAWETPNVPGKYDIIATFSGSKAYYPSSAETYAIVSQAPETTSAPTPLPASVADTYFLPAIAGIILALVVGFALLAVLLLKKRP